MTKPDRYSSYKDAGVDIDAGDAWAKIIARKVERTYGPQVIGGIGGFAGMFRLNEDGLFSKNYHDPVLVSCADGVGTKLLVAIMADRYETLGIDLVAMNVNDLVVAGTEPLFFLDYIATGQLNPQGMTSLIEGISEGCFQAGCALLGGETAEMPDLYAPGHFDLAGFSVGVVERTKIIDGSNVQPGDTIIGLPSSGLHSNGFSLVRKIFFDKLKLKIDSQISELGCTVADELLKPTKIYVPAVLALLRKYRVKRIVRGMAHITGGGLLDNVPRCLPRNCTAVIRRNSWPMPPIFNFLQKHGRIKPAEMYRVFNMGIGFILIVRSAFADAVVGHLQNSGQEAVIIGRVKRGRRQVELR